MDAADSADAPISSDSDTLNAQLGLGPSTESIDRPRIATARNPHKIYYSAADIYRDPRLETEEKIRLLEKWITISDRRYSETRNIEHLNEVRATHNILSFLRQHRDNL